MTRFPAWSHRSGQPGHRDARILGPHDGRPPQLHRWDVRGERVARPARSDGNLVGPWVDHTTESDRCAHSPPDGPAAPSF